MTSKKENSSCTKKREPDLEQSDGEKKGKEKGGRFCPFWAKKGPTEKG